MITWVALFALASPILGARASSDSRLSIEIMVPKSASSETCLQYDGEFSVRLTNHTSRAIAIWDGDCRLGYENLSFLVDDVQQADRPVVSRTPRAKDYPLKTITIRPKQSVLIQVSFAEFFWGERRWVSPPEPNSGENISIRAVYENLASPEGARRKVWTGRLVSPAVSVLVVDATLKTPLDYLWNACPNRALAMMKADRTWVNKSDRKYDCAPLHHAARFGYTEVVRWLIDNGADVNAVGINGFTPLHFSHSREIAIMLIKAGANMAHVDSWGETAIQFAIEEKNQSLVDAILDSGYKPDLLTMLMLKRRDRAIEMLIRDPDAIVGGMGGATLYGNRSPLGIAASDGDLEMAELLLEAGAPINDSTESPNAGYTTPLSNAVWKGNVAMVELLLSHGASTNCSGGKFYWTIVAYAKEHSDKRIVALLRKYKGNSRAEFSPFAKEIKNKLPGRIASGSYKLPASIKELGAGRDAGP